MKEIIIKNAIAALLAALPKGMLGALADKLLDAIEDAVKRSETEVDDAVVYPLIRVIRVSYNIPDLDDDSRSDASRS